MESDISIHALREEGDCFCCCHHLVVLVFQSTPSARRATSSSSTDKHPQHNFNPRPPRGGRRSLAFRPSRYSIFQSTPSARRATVPWPSGPRGTRYFNPRPPRGGRPMCGVSRSQTQQFQSTPSARRATDGVLVGRGRRAISIHALREEGDSSFPSALEPLKYFNPRPPRGGRLPARPAESHDQRISIHALREEGD